ncbi:MAG TPA: pentapeptide repeat-containing protein [Polyangiaceae bacterium]|nr:pentapeptide repeat-containing protein [Polyangiaceae bacterium]
MNETATNAAATNAAATNAAPTSEAATSEAVTSEALTREAATNAAAMNAVVTNEAAMNDVEVQLTRDQAVILLTDGERGVSEWNEHCRVGHGTKNLQNALLNGAYLRGVNLAHTDLTDARLMEANLSEADLTEAELAEADLREADLRDACLAGASLIQANLNRAHLMGTRLVKAKLSYASLIHANLTGADLSEASINRAHLNEANLLGCTLVRAKLSCTELTGAKLARANLTQADLTEADLRGADLSGANLAGANLEGAELQGATLNGASLEGAKLSHAKLDEELDLRLFDWETLTIDGTAYRRDAVESGTQLLPGARPPLKISFSLGAEVTSADLAALQELVRSGTMPKGTSVYLAFTPSGVELVLEGRGSLDQAALLGAVLIALPNLQAAGEPPVPAEAPSPSLHASLAAASSPELLECARKLSRVSVRPRAHAELERFRTVLQRHGVDNDAVVSNQVVTLVHRSRAADRVMLDALGFGGPSTVLAEADHDASSQPSTLS